MTLDDLLSQLDTSALWVPAVPKGGELFSPLVDVIALQLFAYFVAKGRGCDVDQPRNLAKTVTVE